MAPAAYATTYCAQADIEAELSVDGAALRLDDDQSGVVDPAELTRLTLYCVNYATAKVNDYALERYVAADLATSWAVNKWASVIAARELCARRGNPIPSSVEKRFEETMEDLKALKAGTYSLADLSERMTGAILWSNVRVDSAYGLRKARVERPISEQTPPRVSPNYDRVADLTVEF